jgi:hypothetical protein
MRALVVFAFVLAILGGAVDAKGSRSTPVQERVLLRPDPGTFYSVDVLNPDVIRWHGRYWMFFSGNSVRTDAGDWRTGVAVSRSPLGPFRTLPMEEPFLNGSTRIFGNELVQVATPLSFGQPVVYSSSNLGIWTAGSEMPAGSGWDTFQSDPYFDRSGLVYFAARSGPGGADIGSRRYSDGQWGAAKLELRRSASGWDSLDLGEPATFRVGRRQFMLYVGLSATGGSRQIGLAHKTADGWQRCGAKPLIKAGGSWYSKNAIDPEPLVVGKKLYIYFGGGRTASLGGDMNGTIGERSFSTAQISGFCSQR